MLHTFSVAFLKAGRALENGSFTFLCSFQGSFSFHSKLECQDDNLTLLRMRDSGLYLQNGEAKIERRIKTAAMQQCSIGNLKFC